MNSPQNPVNPMKSKALIEVPEKPGKAELPNKPDRPNKPDKLSQPDRLSQSDRLSQLGRPEKPSKQALDTHLDPTITAAWLYYHHDFTQADIAKELGVSRATVANLLTRAKDDGLVTVSLRPDLLSRLTYARELRTRFNLSEVYLVPTPENMLEDEVQRSLGQAAALYLENALKPGEVLGTAWGATMLEVARALKGTPVEGLVVAQSLGSLNSGEGFNPIRVAALMAEKLEARVYHLYVPAVVESVEVKDILLRDRTIRAALEMARSASRLILGVGKVAHNATVVRAGFLDVQTMDELGAKGAVGDLSWRYFDLQGQPVVVEADERIVGLSWDDLHKIRPVIAVAGGPDKAHAVLGALRTGCLDVLITDERVARKVLSLDKADALRLESGHASRG